METLSYLTDVHGPRLTNSPNMRAAAAWAKQRLESYGLANVALEAWGPFGRGWVNERTVADDDRAAALPAARLPEGVDAGHRRRRSRATPSLAVIDKAEDFAKWKGKLKGKIVLRVGRRARCRPTSSRRRGATTTRALTDLDEAADRIRRAAAASAPGGPGGPGARHRRLPQAAHGVPDQGRRAGAGRDVARRSRRQRRRARAGAAQARTSGRRRTRRCCRRSSSPASTTAGCCALLDKKIPVALEIERQEPVRRHRPQLATT